MQIEFVGETYVHQSLKESAQRTLNLYPEIVPNSGATSKYILVGTPGTQLLGDYSDIDTGSCRGLHYTSTSVLYGVYGNHLIEINPDGTAADSWLISGGTSFISFADNGKYLMFTDGNTMWQFNMESNVLQGQSGLPETLEKPQMIKYIGQRFVSFGIDSNQFWWSGIGPDGPLTWEGTGFASAEGSADYITSMGVSDGELVLFGPRSYQVFRLSNDVDAPFSPVGGSFTNIGCGAPWSVTEIMGTMFWLGSSTAGKNQVFKLQGYNAVPVTNPAISNILDGLDRSAPNDVVNTTSDAVGFAYQQNNHMFYVLNLRQANKTLVYDTIDQWHERSTRNPVYNTDDRWEPLFCAYAYGRVVVGNSKVPYLMELRLDKYTEYDGRLIKRLRVGPCIDGSDNEVLFHKSLTLSTEAGVGLLPSGSGNNPQAMLRWSDGGGQGDWSSERWQPLGKRGQYSALPKWNGLGKGRFRVYELTITAPVQVVILNMTAEVEASKHR